MEESKSNQTWFTPFLYLDGFAMHAPREAAEVTGDRWMERRFCRPPCIVANRVGENSKRGERAASLSSKRSKRTRAARDDGTQRLRPP